MFSDSGLIMGWGGTRLNITVGDVREIFNATCTVMMKMAKHLNSESKCVRMLTIESFDAMPTMTIMVVQIAHVVLFPIPFSNNSVSNTLAHAHGLSPCARTHHLSHRCLLTHTHHSPCFDSLKVSRLLAQGPLQRHQTHWRWIIGRDIVRSAS